MKQERKTKGIPDAVDKFVGQRVRENRILLGWTQEYLADELGVTFQQVQKYERGVNRLSASRIYQVSRLMGKPMSAFYPEGKNATPAPANSNTINQILRVCAKIKSKEDLKRLRIAVNLITAAEAV